MVNFEPGEYVRRMTFHLVTQATRKKKIRVFPTYDILVTLQILYHYAKGDAACGN